MVASRRMFGFRIVNILDHQIVKEEFKLLSDKEFEKENKKWKKEERQMGSNFLYISTLIYGLLWK